MFIRIESVPPDLGRLNFGMKASKLLKLSPDGYVRDTGGLLVVYEHLTKALEG